MTATTWTEANPRLRGEGDFIAAPTRFLGHYVVGRLARQLGIEVQLAPSPVTGVTARIVLPAAMLEFRPAVERAPQDDDAPPARRSAPLPTARSGRGAAAAVRTEPDDEDELRPPAHRTGRAAAAGAARAALFEPAAASEPVADRRPARSHDPAAAQDGELAPCTCAQPSSDADPAARPADGPRTAPATAWQAATTRGPRRDRAGALPPRRQRR